jgi:hypothetical protein
MSGRRSTVQYGNGCFVRCARIILVVIRPKTKDMVTQKRTNRFSLRSEEYGEESQAKAELANTMIGVHSKNTGRTGRFWRLRERATWYTHAGTCAVKNVMRMIVTQKSKNV